MNLETNRETEKESCRKCPNHLHVCLAAGCLSSQSQQVKEKLEAQIKAKGLEGQCRVKGVGCMGLCAAGPLVSLPEKRDVQGRRPPTTRPKSSAAFNRRQARRAAALPDGRSVLHPAKKIVLENCGDDRPERIEEYIAADGYVALHKALTA
jgi:bidirectional [NiFe] hydrogenase diaphorase subunit